jgi:hypothetical protein
MQKWEYMTVESQLKPAPDTQLNALGIEGWELVGVTAYSDCAYHTYVFKRPKR